MYNMGDNTYLKQPKFMSRETVTAFAERLKSYCDGYQMDHVYVSFHGGEPLLASKDFYHFTVNEIRGIMADIKVYFIMQTNGTLLDNEWCSLFRELDVQLGISIDGPQAYHDKYRVYHSNEGSFDHVVNGVKKRNEYGIGGLISVINIDIPPSELYTMFKDLDAVRINILLPDGHYQNYPDGFKNKEKSNSTPYGDWLVMLYEIWKSDISSRPNITFFSNIVSLLLGYKNGDELIGRNKNGAICIETDGAIEVVDPLRICRNGFTKNSLNVKQNEIGELEQNPLFDLFYNSHDIICGKCNQCQLKNICGGGYLPHRYSPFNGFDNPSIYCKDLAKIIAHIQNDIIASFPEELVAQLNLTPIDFHLQETFANETHVETEAVHHQILKSFKDDFFVLKN
jgi:uncharacterized protein